MLPIGSIVVDFDGTACVVDVSESLLEAFGDERIGGYPWEWYGEMVDRHEMGLRDAAAHQAAMLAATREQMIEKAVAECPLDPTFEPFVAWAEERELPLTLVSDGFGFYIQPILEAAGLERLSVVTNGFVYGNGVRTLQHPNGHPECVGCGTCKMLAVLRAREQYGPVAFVGEGQSDRYGALYADVVFAKDELVPICERDGVPSLRWTTFDDVRAELESLEEMPGAVTPQICPGWRTA